MNYNILKINDKSWFDIEESEKTIINLYLQLMI